MKLEIPDSMVYVGIGIVMDRVFQNIFDSNFKSTINKVMYKMGGIQIIKELENRRIVDVCGDTLGYFDIEGNIVKGELNE